MSNQELSPKQIAVVSGIFLALAGIVFSIGATVNSRQERQSETEFQKHRALELGMPPEEVENMYGTEEQKQEQTAINEQKLAAERASQ